MLTLSLPIWTQEDRARAGRQEWERDKFRPNKTGLLGKQGTTVEYVEVEILLGDGLY